MTALHLSSKGTLVIDVPVGETQDDSGKLDTGFTPLQLLAMESGQITRNGNKAGIHRRDVPRQDTFMVIFKSKGQFQVIRIKKRKIERWSQQLTKNS